MTYTASYNAQDQLTRYGMDGLLIPARTEYYWDDDKRPTRVEYPDGGDVAYTYDPDKGRLDTVTYQRCAYAEGVEDTSCAVERTIAYGYEITPAQRLSSVVATTEERSESIAYAYNGMLPLTETMSGTVNGTISYEHNGFFEMSGIVVNGKRVDYTYDKDGLLTGAGDLTISRNAASGLVDWTNIGAVTTTNGYSYGEISNQRTEVGAYNRYTYYIDQRDAVGRITWKSEVIGDTVHQYGYRYNSRGWLEEVRRIDEEGNDTAIFFALYDKNGNRTAVMSPYYKHNGGSAAYDPQDRLVTYGDYRYEYTAAGALSKKKDDNHTWYDPSDDKITTYRYDQGGNLLEVNLPNGKEIEYTYDALNRRIAKRVDGTTAYKLLYSGQLAPVARLDEENRVVEQYIYGTRVNVPEYMEKEGRKYRFVTDHRGSVRLVVDTHDGKVMQRTDYDESGMIIGETLETGWQPVIFGYAGGLQDRDTGLIRFGARDYDPEVGRWTSKEPLGFNGSSNFYVYAHNDPVNFIDPTGLWDWGSFGEGLLEGLENMAVGAGVGLLLVATLPASTVVAISGTLGVLGAGLLGWETGQTLYDFLTKELCPEEDEELSQKAGNLVIGLLSLGLNKWFGAKKNEIEGENWKVAPFGNRTDHPTGKYPHYHRRGIDPTSGKTVVGQGIGRHRPWDTRQTDQSFLDRF